MHKQQAPSNRLPTFLIVGMAKAGTSSLYAYLAEHPQIYVSPERVPNFWGLGEQPEPRYGGPVKRKPIDAPTLAHYTALFAAARDEIALGEGSSFFNFTPRAAERIQHYMPEAKLLFSLRQPAERAYSQYLYARRMGWEPASQFSAALKDEARRKAEAWFPFLCYRASSLTAATLRVFYELFPRDQIHLSLFEDFRRQTPAVMRSIYTFLGVEPDFTPNLSVQHNPGRVGLWPWLRSPLNPKTAFLWRCLPSQARHFLFRKLDNFARKPSLAPTLRADLTRSFHADILETQALIGRDLSAWLERVT